MELEDNNDAWIADHCINPVDVPGVLLTRRDVSKAAMRLQGVTSTVLRAFGIAAFRSGRGETAERVLPTQCVGGLRWPLRPTAARRGFADWCLR